MQSLRPQDTVVQQLADRGCHALAVHGGKAQQELPRFREGGD